MVRATNPYFITPFKKLSLTAEGKKFADEIENTKVDEWWKRKLRNDSFESPLKLKKNLSKELGANSSTAFSAEVYVEGESRSV